MLFLVSLLAFPEFANAGALPSAPGDNPCDYAPRLTLRIACSVQWGPDCGDKYKNAVLEAAGRMSVDVNFVSIMGNPSVSVSDPGQSFDAVISPGGDDILPEYFLTQRSDAAEIAGLREKMRKEFYDEGLGTTSEADKQRDAFEFSFASRYLSDPRYKDIPFLATCYGMQMMGAVAGLPLYVDLERDIGVPAQRQIEPKISTVEPDSWVGKAFGGGSFTGAKNHHQAIDFEYYREHRAELSRFRITASSVDGKIADVLEIQDRPFLGIQFHAERSAERTKQAVYDWLVQQACKGAKSRTSAAAAPH